MDLSKLSTGDKVIGIGAIVYLIAMFLPWEGYDYNILGASASYSNSGWSYFWTGILPLLLIALVVAKVAISRFSPATKLPDIPIAWGQAILGAAVAAAVLVVLRLLIPSSKYGGTHISGAPDLDRKYGLFLAVIAAIAVAVGAFLKYQAKEEDEAAPGTQPPTSF